jgi:hypothetical protein
VLRGRAFGKVDERDIDVAWFLVALGVLGTAVSYQFAMGNQLEQLPIILRFLDPNYLRGDFYVDAGTAFGPRYYYALALANLGRFVPLYVANLCAALLTNILLTSVSYLAARDLLRADRLTGCIAATLSVAVTSFDLGMAASVHFQDYSPAAAAMPFALLALWLGIAGKPIWAIVFATGAVVAHPLVGTETAGLALIASATRVVLQEWRNGIAVTAQRLVRPLLGGGLLALVVFLVWSLPTLNVPKQQLTREEVVGILATFRAPFHYLPSYFRLRDYVGWAAFSLAAGMCWTRWWRAQGKPRDAWTLLAPPITVVLMCALSYPFVELWGSQTWTIAQVFRMLNTFKWLGFLFMAWQLAEWLRDPDWFRQCVGYVALCGSGKGHPTVFLAAIAVDRLHAALVQSNSRVAHWISPVLLFGGVLPFALLNRWSNELLVVAMGAALWSLLGARGERKPFGRALSLGGVLALVTGVLINRETKTIPATALTPIVTEADQTTDDADVARWARLNTPSDALFITPPDFGILRIAGRRGIVVDHTAVPFGAEAIREWYSRVLHCYGPFPNGKDDAFDVMTRNYQGVTPARLEQIKHEYGVSYAILFADTSTPKVVLYRNPSFKVIAL